MPGDGDLAEINVVDVAWRDATPAQQGIWVLDTDEKLRPTYLIPTVLEFTGALRHDLLVAAAQSAVSRHPALRSRFRLDTATRRVQYHTDGPPGEIGFIDAVADGWSAEELDGLVDVLCWTPFDLATEAQVRGEVVRVDETTTLLVLTMHHISFDGWSRHLLVDEVMSTYRCLLEGREPRLSPAAHPADLVTVLSGQELAERVDEAVERLRGAPTTIGLPYDRRSATPSVIGANLALELDAELSGAVLEVASQEGCTPFMTAVALLAGTFSRTTGQRDFLFALGWPGREDPATADAIGMFMSTLVLRVEFDDTTTWRELLACARSGALEAFMDCDVPLDAIATALNPGRQVIWPPMTPVLVNVDDLPLELDLAPGVTGRYRLTGPVYTKYDLDLFVRVDDHGPDGSRLTLSIDYPLDLFDHQTIEGLLSALRRSAHDLAYSAEESHDRPADH
ncbi:condensation domain-containing protein [Lentzea alba]